MKKRLLLLIILLAIAAFLLTYEFVSNLSKGDKMAELTLSLSLDKPTYKSGEPIYVLITLQNTGNEYLIVNKRMSLNFPDAPKMLRDISFTITESSGKITPFTARINVRPVNENDFVRLAPEEKIEMSYDIKRVYDLDTVGTYSILSVYQNVLDPKKTGSAWKGEIKSNEVIFEIVP